MSASTENKESSTFIVITTGVPKDYDSDYVRINGHPYQKSVIKKEEFPEFKKDNYDMIFGMVEIKNNEMTYQFQKVDVIPIFFNPKKPNTDFENMIKSPDNNHALFIFNDNTFQYDDSLSPGGGNAAIRPYKENKRAWGIPTGPGFDKLDENAKNWIDRSIMDIRDIILEKNYSTIFYSGETKRVDGKILKGRTLDDGFYYIGSSIFEFGDDVKKYIAEQLEKLADVYFDTIDE